METGTKLNITFYKKAFPNAFHLLSKKMELGPTESMYAIKTTSGEIRFTFAITPFGDREQKHHRIMNSTDLYEFFAFYLPTEEIQFRFLFKEAWVLLEMGLQMSEYTLDDIFNNNEKRIAFKQKNAIINYELKQNREIYVK